MRAKAVGEILLRRASTPLQLTKISAHDRRGISLAPALAWARAAVRHDDMHEIRRWQVRGLIPSHHACGVALFAGVADGRWWHLGNFGAGELGCDMCALKNVAVVVAQFECTVRHVNA